MDQELVPVRRNSIVTVGMSLMDCPTNLPMSTARGRSLAFAAGNPGDYDFDKQGVVEIAATHWLIFPDEGADPESGEVHQYSRLVLFDSKGKFFRTTSEFAAKRLQSAMSLWTNSDWEKGINFVISRRVGKAGRTYHDIRVKHDGE